MYYKLKLLSICFLLFFLSCKNKKENSNNYVAKLKSYCQIPLEIENYLKENKEDWSKMDLDDFDKELLDYLSGHLEYEDNQSCPYFVYGDFNHNEEKDFAIIVVNKNKEDEEKDYASLLIFHDYESNFSPPYIPLKDVVDTERAMIKSAIYSVREYGILSYLEKGDICGISVVDINYFQKSGFFVYWNKEKKKYRFLHGYETKEILCDIITGRRSKYITQWQGKYSFGFGGVHMGEEFEGGATIEVKEGDKKSSINLYWETKNIETGNTIDKGDTTSQLEIVRVLKDTLELQGEKDKQYILYKTQFIVDDKKKNGYAIRGSSVYMLSPPNNDYPLTKSKTYVFYTNVDNLRVRAKPELKGGSLELLPINKEITYLGEKSKNQTTVTLNGENITDYWYKVKTPKGNIGWVHGCCVSFK